MTKPQLKYAPDQQLYVDVLSYLSERPFKETNALMYRLQNAVVLTPVAPTQTPETPNENKTETPNE